MTVTDSSGRLAPIEDSPVTREAVGCGLWGGTVNIASRRESHGVPGSIQISASTHALVKDRFRTEPRGEIEVKGKGRMNTWLMTGLA